MHDIWILRVCVEESDGGQVECREADEVLSVCEGGSIW